MCSNIFIAKTNILLGQMSTVHNDRKFTMNLRKGRRPHQIMHVVCDQSTFNEKKVIGDCQIHVNL